MSARPESKFWNWLRDKLPGHIQRIENGVDRGTPDVNLCWGGDEIWIELKVAENYHVDLRKEQRVWAVRRTRDGGKVFCLADMGDGTVAAWKLPVETYTVNETYQRIVEIPHFVATKEEVNSILAWMFKP